VAVFVGIQYRFGTKAAAPAAAPGTSPDAASPAAPVPAPPATPPRPAETAFELTVVDDTGAPVPGARAHLSIGSYERDLVVDAGGHGQASAVPLGAGKIVVSAPGFEAGERSVELVAGSRPELRVELKALPPPSQVRGVVRTFAGVGLVAKIRVEPLGAEVVTGGDGRFSVDVPPGSYEVVIEASGYRPQRRKVTVDAQGVVILNAELANAK
jgi:hypothetical protein